MRRIAIAAVGVLAAGFVAAAPAAAAPSGGGGKHLHHYTASHWQAAHKEVVNAGGPDGATVGEASAASHTKVSELDKHKYYFHHWAR
ncbi:hypothetical protein ACH4GK_30965 [Streptomyces rimosus]|uniref:hypothetical protein n=1 Tax=Streptomyces rimosus TaxID=1927 RepID=UPI0004C8AF0C|nr:hypothetical protein [Streptomyces rimosus]